MKRRQPRGPTRTELFSSETGNSSFRGASHRHCLPLPPPMRRLGCLRREWHRHMLVNALPLVVVFRMQLPVGTGDHLGGLVRLEAQITLLVFFRQLVIAKPVVTKHKVVVRL